MDQTTANAMNEKGGIIFCLDVPEKTEIGIDFNSWYVGQKFMGIKMIPTGIHAIFGSYMLYLFDLKEYLNTIVHKIIMAILDWDAWLLLM